MEDGSGEGILKQEFLAALHGRANHKMLLELVHRYQAQGLTAQKSYLVLEQIWQELGFDGADQEGNVQDNLEYVMEKVWFQGTGNSESSDSGEERITDGHHDRSDRL